MRLYLVRHGDAISEQADPERPLSDMGRQEVMKVARFLIKRKEPFVDLIVHSDKKRAAQTAQIFKEIFSPHSQLMEKDGLSPNDSIEGMSRMIEEVGKDFMAVGHLPYMSRLVSRLVVGEECREVVAFPTATVAALEKNADGRWNVIFSISPEQISL